MARHMDASARDRRVQDALARYIDAHGGTSFVEMERVFDECGYDYRGDRSIRLPGNDTVFLWNGWNEDACRIAFGLLERGYAVVPCHSVVYYVDGSVPVTGCDIARSAKRRYASPRWLPCVWCRDGFEAGDA